MPIKDAVLTIVNRNAFYRDGYRLLLRISLIQACVIALLVAAIVGLAMTIKPRSIYFATTSDGRIINIVPLNEPYLTPAQLIAWTASTTQGVMRFGYHDYRDRLQQSSSNFTQTGWDSFNKALKEANFIDAIQARKLVVSMDIDAAPEIQNAFVRNAFIPGTSNSRSRSSLTAISPRRRSLPRCICKSCAFRRCRILTASASSNGCPSTRTASNGRSPQKPPGRSPSPAFGKGADGRGSD